MPEGMWFHRKNGHTDSPSKPMTVEESKAAFREARRKGLIKHEPSRSRRLRNRNRYDKFLRQPPTPEEQDIRV